MLTRWTAQLLFLGLVLAVPAVTGSAQVTQSTPGMLQNRTGPRDPTATRDTASGRIKGRVVGGDTGAPLRRAVVYISGNGIEEGRVTSTDENGRYEFSELPSGRFGMHAFKAGYVLMSYGQRRPMQGGKSIELAEGQVVDRIDFTLPRSGVIAGRILDEFGEPVAGLDVQVLRNVFRNGRRQLAPVGGRGRQTDDRGEYRIYGLPPGEYYVSARMSLSGPFGDDSESRSGFGITYYPGVVNIAQAAVVSVGAGAEHDSINFAVLPVRTVRVSGVVTNSQGRPVRQGTIMVQSGAGEMMFTMAAAGMIKPDGTFTVGSLPPGEYTLRVNTATGPNDDDAESGAVMIAVGTEDETNVAIATTAAIRLAGQLVFETPQSTSLKADQFSLFAQVANSASAMMFGRTATVRKDWTFELFATEGPVLIRPARIPEGLVLKAVMLNGVDVTDTGVVLRPGQPVDGLQVILSNRVSGIVGTVTDEQGALLKDYTVLIFPNDANRWMPGSRFFAIAGPDQQGRFEAKKLPAGDYLVVAMDSIEEGQQTNPEFLQQASAYATSVQLNEGEKHPVTLKLVTAP
jgi:hypothetical protein